MKTTKLWKTEDHCPRLNYADDTLGELLVGQGRRGMAREAGQ